MSGFAVASAQRNKVRGSRCLYCGNDGVDPAHVWPRSRGGCGDPYCVVPLCRDCHERFDRRKGEPIDILPSLLSGGFHAELAHPISAHRVSPTDLLARVTGGEDPDRLLEIVKPLVSQVRQHRQATESRLGLIAAASRKASPDELMLGPDRLLYEVAQAVEEELAIAGFLEARP